MSGSRRGRRPCYATAGADPGSSADGRSVAQAVVDEIIAAGGEAISHGAAQSWQMDNRWHTMAADNFDDFGFAIDWMRKDLGLALDEGRGLGLSLPITAMIDQFYADVQAMGGGRQDTSAIIRRLPRRGRK